MNQSDAARCGAGGPTGYSAAGAITTVPRVAGPIDNRKDLLLLILAANDADPVVGVTRLQKYLFLLQEEERWHEKYGIAEPYRFRPYDYGPFDDKLYADLQFLENVGLVVRRPAGEEPPVEEDEHREASNEWGTNGPEFAPWADDDQIWAYRLTDKGRRFVETLALEQADRHRLEGMKQQWNGRPLAQFLRWLYDRHPDFARNTKLRHLRPSER